MARNDSPLGRQEVGRQEWESDAPDTALPGLQRRLGRSPISGIEGDALEAERHAPSLPIILLSAAFGVGAGIVGFYFAYRLAHLRIELSAGIAAIALSAALGITGALLSSVTGSRSALSNIGFSCGLILLMLLFFGLCTVIGGLAATLILTLGTAG